MVVQLKTLEIKVFRLGNSEKSEEKLLNSNNKTIVSKIEGSNTFQHVYSDES